MTREDELPRDNVDGLESESRQLGRESPGLENADLPLRGERTLSTIAAQELRLQELLGKLDTATRLRLLHADDPRERPKS